MPASLVLGVVGWIDDFELELLAGLGAAQGVGECLDGVFAANFDEGVFAADGFRVGWLGFGFGGGFGRGVCRRVGRRRLNLALVGDLGPIAVLERTVFFDRLDGGAGVAEMTDFVLELFVGDFDRWLVDLDVFVAVDGEGGNELEDGFDVERRALFKRELGDLRLADGTDVQLADTLVEALGEHGVDDFLADFGGEAAADDGLRHLAGTEAGDFGVFAVAVR